MPSRLTVRRWRWPDSLAIRTIIFDLGKVIVDFSFDESYGRMQALSGLAPDEIRARLMDGDLVVATVNLLDRKGHYTAARVAAMEALVRERTPALLAALRGERF